MQGIRESALNSGAEGHYCGADALGADAGGWLAHWLPRLTRQLRHPGNYRYLFPIESGIARHLPLSQPYPKLES